MILNISNFSNTKYNIIFMIKYKIRYEENIFVAKKLNNEKQEYSIYLVLKKLDILLIIKIIYI